MSKFILSVLVSSAIFVHRIKGSSIDDLKQKFTNVVMECAIENSITTEDAELLKTKEIPDNENLKCLLACVFKKAGMMNDQGMLSVEGVREMGKKYFSDDADEAKKNEKFIEACKSVNTEAVSDGTRGCDRAVLIYKCSMEKLPEFELAV